MKEYRLTINDNSYTVVIKDVTDDAVFAEVNGTRHVIHIDTIENMTRMTESTPVQPAASSPATATPVKPVAASNAGTGTILTPIPGQVLSVSVSVGEQVRSGQKLLVLEAMKLENSITATMDGTVDEILVKEGDVVNQGQTLIVIT